MAQRQLQQLEKSNPNSSPSCCAMHTLKFDLLFTQSFKKSQTYVPAIFCLYCTKYLDLDVKLGWLCVFIIVCAFYIFLPILCALFSFCAGLLHNAKIYPLEVKISDFFKISIQISLIFFLFFSFYALKNIQPLCIFLRQIEAIHF